MIRTKLCKCCDTEKPLSAFSKRRQAPDGRQAKCKRCASDYQRAHKYGLSVSQYHSLIKSQGGRCAICDEKKPLVVDHNHSTGKIRGLLCSDCNSGIGLLKDSVEVIRRAEGYLLHDY